VQAIIDEFAWAAAYQIAEGYKYRNEVDKVFEWLERAYAQRDPGVVYTASDPLLRALHRDPRWEPFLRKLGFAAGSALFRRWRIA
jgi:hypothetical protein